AHVPARRKKRRMSACKWVMARSDHSRTSRNRPYRDLWICAVLGITSRASGCNAILESWANHAGIRRIRSKGNEDNAVRRRRRGDLPFRGPRKEGKAQRMLGGTRPGLA